MTPTSGPVRAAEMKQHLENLLPIHKFPHMNTPSTVGARESESPDEPLFLHFPHQLGMALFFRECVLKLSPS